jgi:hypothetical protein
MLNRKPFLVLQSLFLSMVKNDYIGRILFKNAVFQFDVLKSGNFRHVQGPGITFSARYKFRRTAFYVALSS